jgi:glycosyltransferase involved in cell wall biosynthesis
MANGVPAISVFGDGTKEIILHQQTAMAVNYGARDEFARWTKFLIEKPDAARQLADQGKAHVREQFSLEQMISAYRALLS